MTLSRVDLPAPLAPMSPTVSPVRMVALTSCRAQRSSYSSRRRVTILSFRLVAPRVRRLKRLQTPRASIAISELTCGPAATSSYRPSQFLGKVAGKAAEEPASEGEQDQRYAERHAQPLEVEADARALEKQLALPGAVRVVRGAVDRALAGADDGCHRVQHVQPEPLVQPIADQPGAVDDRVQPEPGDHRDLDEVRGVAVADIERGHDHAERGREDHGHGDRGNQQEEREAEERETDREHHDEQHDDLKDVVHGG